MFYKTFTYPEALSVKVPTAYICSFVWFFIFYLMFIPYNLSVSPTQTLCALIFSLHYAHHLYINQLSHYKTSNVGDSKALKLEGKIRSSPQNSYITFFQRNLYKEEVRHSWCQVDTTWSQYYLVCIGARWDTAKVENSTYQIRRHPNWRWHFARVMYRKA